LDRNPAALLTSVNLAFKSGMGSPHFTLSGKVFSMTKNKAQKANTRAKKARAKLKDRQVTRAREAAKFREKRWSSFAQFTKNPETGYEFWLLHGANFLLSSYDEGLWNPVFPEAYEGKTVTRTELFKRVIEAHLNTTTNQLSPAGTKTILWCSLKPKEMFALVVRARQFAWAKKGNPITQAQPEVWHFFHTVMEEFAKRLDGTGKTKEGKFTLPVDQYGKTLPKAVADTVANLSGVVDPSLSDH
jgi:hypothetical protein